MSIVLRLPLLGWFSRKGERWISQPRKNSHRRRARARARAPLPNQQHHRVCGLARGFGRVAGAIFLEPPSDPLTMVGHCPKWGGPIFDSGHGDSRLGGFRTSEMESPGTLRASPCNAVSNKGSQQVKLHPSDESKETAVSTFHTFFSFCCVHVDEGVQ